MIGFGKYVVLEATHSFIWRGLGYDSRYYEEPDVYKPSRWYATENVESELFTGFSVGMFPLLDDISHWLMLYIIRHAQLHRS